MTFTFTSARKAGKRKTPAKRASSRANGLLGAAHGSKGGRPGNPEIASIMQERHVTRQRAHQIFAQQISSQSSKAQAKK